jgi:hypothetical protein
VISLYRIALSICFAAVAATGQASDSSNFVCVKELEMPAYPGIARATATQGDVTAQIELGVGGKVVSVKATTADDSPIHRIFATTIENHVPFAKYDPTCSGKTVTLIFRFQIEDTPRPTVGFAYPNVFLISAKAEPLQK